MEEMACFKKEDWNMVGAFLGKASDSENIFRELAISENYADGAVYIPNKELMDKFRELLMNKESMGYVKIRQKMSRMQRKS